MFFLDFFYWEGWDLPPDVEATSNWQCVNSKVCKSVYLWFCFKCVISKYTPTPLLNGGTSESSKSAKFLFFCVGV